MHCSAESVSNGNITNERTVSDILFVCTLLLYRICRFQSGKHSHSNLPGNNIVFLCEM